MRKLSIIDIIIVKTEYKKQESCIPKWIQIDAKNMIVGRLAVFIANELRGKNTAVYTPHICPKNKVIIINTDQIKFSGKKMSDKVYYHHTGYVGGIKGITAEKLKQKNSTLILREAVRRMLPDNKLRKEFLRNLYIYKNEEHKHKNHAAEIVSFNKIHKSHSI